MTNVLTFKIAIEGLENKIWREIEMNDTKTIADLAYTILASFDSLAYHLYNINYKNKVFKCTQSEKLFDDVEYLDATKTRLKNINLMPNDTLTMNYDMGSPTTFIITYLGKETIDGYQGMYYPKVVKGKGKGMIDDISQYELKEIIEDIDKQGYTDYEYTAGYEREEPYDYKNYNIRNDNKMLKGLVLEIKDGYEITES